MVNGNVRDPNWIWHHVVDGIGTDDDDRTELVVVAIIEALFGDAEITDDDLAVMFIAPMDAPGVKLFCRGSYEMQAATMGTPFDYPLSSRFDENDAIFVGRCQSRHEESELASIEKQAESKIKVYIRLRTQDLGVELMCERVIANVLCDRGSRCQSRSNKANASIH